MKVFSERVKLRLPKSIGRSAGLHVSEVIRDLSFKGNVLDKKWKTELALEEQDTHLMQIGLAWEDYLDRSSQFPGLEYHPGELKVRTALCRVCGMGNDEHEECDHPFRTLWIFMSPDGFMWDTETECLAFLAEIKFTKKSCRDFATLLRMESKKCIMWLWQIRAYLKATRTLAAKLYVMFVNGNYSYDEKDPDSGAVKYCFTLIHEPEEIEQNWRMLENHAGEMIRAGRFSL